jgi:hypothetical protein
LNERVAPTSERYPGSRRHSWDLRTPPCCCCCCCYDCDRGCALLTRLIQRWRYETVRPRTKTEKRRKRRSFGISRRRYRLHLPYRPRPHPHVHHPHRLHRLGLCGSLSSQLHLSSSPSSPREHLQISRIGPIIPFSSVQASPFPATHCNAPCVPLELERGTPAGEDMSMAVPVPPALVAGPLK